MPTNKPEKPYEGSDIYDNRAMLALILLLSSCSPSTQQQSPTTPESIVRTDPQPESPQIAPETFRPMTISVPLRLPPLEFRVPPEYEEFSEWVSTKLWKDEGLLRGIITAQYKNQDFRVAMVNYGDREWQYIYNPIIMNNDLKKIFGFNIEGPKEYLKDPPVDLYPAFRVPEKEDARFVHTVQGHMQTSGLLKKLKIVWESEKGVLVKKTKAESK